MKKTIYDNGASKLEIEFDGEYYLITQTVHDVGSQQISVSAEELEEFFDFAH